MATAKIKINESAFYGLFDNVVLGLENLANDVAATVRAEAPVGKRTPSRPKDISIEVRKVENRPVGKHDYVRPQVGGQSVDFAPDVEQFVMREIRKHESGLYQVYGSIGSGAKKGKTVDYPLLNARAIVKLGPKKKVGRDPISDRPILEQSRTTTKLVTGKHLKDSIAVMMDNTGDLSWSATIVADRPYAFYVEKGMGPGSAKRQSGKGRGFMERSLAKHADDIVSGRALKG